MRLSDAIRLGAMLRPKSDGFFFRAGRSCAQGAALEASGLPYDEGCITNCHQQMEQRWPWISQQRARCPVAGCDEMPEESVRYLIPHLNNSFLGHDWTREQIADWVATVEPADGRREGSRTTDAVREDVDATTV